MCKPLRSCYSYFYLPKHETDPLPWWVPTREPKREVLPQPLTLLRFHICDQESRDCLTTTIVAVWELLVSPPLGTSQTYHRYTLGGPVWAVATARGMLDPPLIYIPRRAPCLNHSLLHTFVVYENDTQLEEICVIFQKMTEFFPHKICCAKMLYNSIAWLLTTNQWLDKYHFTWIWI